MASLSKSLALFLVLNLLSFSLISACGSGCGSGNPYPKHTPKPQPKPQPKPSTPTYPGTGGSPSTRKNCPSDTLKLDACANVLDLLKLKLGEPPKEPCCPLVQGLIDAEAAICLCTAIKANILGISLNISLDLNLLVNYCGCELPSGFQCP